MKGEHKGSALVAAIMVTMIILIIAGGLIFVTGNQRKLTAGQIADDRLFYAAEAGLAKAVKRLRLLSMEQFTAPKAADVALVSNLTDFDFNGATVDVLASWNSTLLSWNLSAAATDKNSGRKCVVALDNIMCQAFTSRSLIVQQDMPASVRFVGVKSGSDYQPNDMMLGDLFFGGRINIEADPIFKGRVTSSSRDFSIRSANSVTEYNQDLNSGGLSSAQRLMHNSQFTNGIWDMTDLNESVNSMKTRYANKMFKDGYEGNSAAVENPGDVVASFDDVLNPAKRPSAIKGTPYVVNVGPADDVSVQIEDGYITVRPKPADWEQAKMPFNDNQNAILFEGTGTAGNRIAIKNSVINGNLTLMSRNVDIEIDGEIKYNELVGPYNNAIAGFTYPFMWANNAVSASSPRNGDNVVDLAKKLQTNGSSMFGCVVENGNIWLGNDLCKNSTDIRGVTMLNGAFYAPNGKFGIRVNGDNGASDFGTISKKGSRDAQDGWYPGSDGLVLTRVVLIGSVMMNSVGKFRQIKGEVDLEGNGSGPNGYWWYWDRPTVYKQKMVKPASWGPDETWVLPVYDKFGNLKPGTGVYKPVFHPAEWENEIPLVVLTQGRRDSLWISTAKKFDSTRGFEGAFCTDFRFSEDGFFPAVFRPLRTADGFVYNNRAAVWSCNYK